MIADMNFCMFIIQSVHFRIVLILPQLVKNFPSISWDLEVHKLVHNSLPHVSALSHIAPLNAFPSDSCKLHSDIILPAFTSTQWSVTSAFPAKILHVPVFLLSI
jgi:hypothetical protein